MVQYLADGLFRHKCIGTSPAIWTLYLLSIFSFVGCISAYAVKAQKGLGEAQQAQNFHNGLNQNDCWIMLVIVTSTFLRLVQEGQLPSAVASVKVSLSGLSRFLTLSSLLLFMQKIRG